MGIIKIEKPIYYKDRFKGAFILIEYNDENGIFVLEELQSHRRENLDSIFYSGIHVNKTFDTTSTQREEIFRYLYSIGVRAIARVPFNLAIELLYYKAEKVQNLIRRLKEIETDDNIVSKANLIEDPDGELNDLCCEAIFTYQGLAHPKALQTLEEAGFEVVIMKKDHFGMRIGGIMTEKGIVQFFK